MKRRHFLQNAAAFSLGTTAVAQDPSGNPVKIGQIGTAHGHAAGKMGTLRKYPDQFDVVGIVEPDDARWEAVRNRKEYRDLKRLSEEQLFNDEEVRAVAVETAVRDLVPTALRCVEAGFHIHLDKPAGPSMSAFRRLHQIASRKKRVIQMGYMLRYNPGIQLCQKAVRDGWLGEVFELHAVMSKTSGNAARREMGEFHGGAMFELGCHLIDSAVYLLGKPDNVESHLRRTRDGDSLADNTLAVLGYPKATATIRSALVEYDGFERRQFVICGPEGTVDIKPLEPPGVRLGLSKDHLPFYKGYRDIKVPKSPGRYDAELLDLASMVRGEKEPDFSPAHDLAVHETVLRASGMPVD